MFTQNTSYLSNRSWGYDQRKVLYIAIPDGAAFEKLNVLMKQEPGVLSISGCTDHLGKNNATAIVHFPDRQAEADQLSVAANYFETMGLHLAAGRVFKENYETDKNTIVVNELFVKNNSLKNPLGQVIKIDSARYQVIGVINDFHSYSFFKKIKPTIFRMADKESYHYLALKVMPGSENKTYKSLQAGWAQLYPEIPFDGGYQEDIWGDYYEEIGVHAMVWKVVALIAILLTVLGLYGLMKLNIAGRLREFSIRKVLGAGVRSIADAITRQYVILLAVALTIAAPISYFLMRVLFDLAYNYHMPITFTGVMMAVVILIMVVLITISTQIRKVFKASPVNGLKVD